MGDTAVSAGIMDWGLLLYVERCQVLRKGNIEYLTCKHTLGQKLKT